MDKVQKVREKVEKRYECWKEKESNSHSIESEIRMSECQHLLLMLDSLQEEPVSEDLEKIVEEIAEPTILNAYGTKELARRLRNTICGTSVSEDLEKAAEDYGIRQGLELKPFAIKYFKAGAKWQKQQDQSTIELAEDHAMLAGMEKMKEEMKAKAVETTFNVSLTSSLYDKLGIKGCKEGDKLLVIKKDEL